MKMFSERWAMVRAGMERAAVRSGRSLNDVSLVAVSKGHPIAALEAAQEAGQVLFGESRVQEAREKVAALPAAMWHFIGHLQKNKARQALPLFEMIESVHSLELAQVIDRIAGETGTSGRVLLEINVGEEGSKHGFTTEQVKRELESLLDLPRVQVQGLMAIPPYSEVAEDSRRYFVRLRELRDELEQAFALQLPSLSMGMSGDYEVAIEEGATLVRVGTALFGERQSV